MPRIVRLHQTGGPEVLKIAEEPLTEPGKGEAHMIGARAIAVTRKADKKARLLEAGADEVMGHH